jgi:hypothetical protein
MFARTVGHQFGNNRSGSSAFRRMIMPSGATTTTALRYLNVHEYISMEIMKAHGIQVPESHVASTPEEAIHIFTNILNKREWHAKLVNLNSRDFLLLLFFVCHSANTHVSFIFISLPRVIFCFVLLFGLQPILHPKMW